jgi:hypothetical protein
VVDGGSVVDGAVVDGTVDDGGAVFGTVVGAVVDGAGVDSDARAPEPSMSSVASTAFTLGTTLSRWLYEPSTT